MQLPFNEIYTIDLLIILQSEDNAFIARTDKDTGDTVYLTISS
jgi:hypothetical protein